jgi:hypothetical protein
MERTNRPVVGRRVSRANIIKASGEDFSVLRSRSHDNKDPIEQKRQVRSILHLMWWREQGTFAPGVPPALPHRFWWRDYGHL